MMVGSADVVNSGRGVIHLFKGVCSDVLMHIAEQNYNDISPAKVSFCLFVNVFSPYHLIHRLN